VYPTWFQGGPRQLATHDRDPAAVACRPGRARRHKSNAAGHIVLDRLVLRLASALAAA
jgi:hypothetical protein